VTNQFKIFTNVHSAIVDPKHFNPQSFVDYEGDYCLIPPNSFVLSRTVEYFRIPRNVLTICIGKSTYARCFRGDTRVALVDGSAPTLEEMATRAADGELFWGYSIGENGRMIVSLLDNPRYVGRDALVEVVLDEGQSVFCTPDHQFMMRDGRWTEAGQLRPGNTLMSLQTKKIRTYEMAYQPAGSRFGSTFPVAAPSDLMRCRSYQVSAVYDVPGTHDVYCLTVPEAGNFALEAGVFVHNCGLIVNVTPFEPMWEGYVTLEISNTTPLPARIYANEGIAQVLFFEGDEPCEVSYADRKGKYQGQQTIVLPRI
jgi:deoxycytidine triphosphate deaminase